MIANGGVISVIGYLGKFDSIKMPNVPLLALDKAAIVREILIGRKYIGGSGDFSRTAVDRN